MHLNEPAKIHLAPLSVLRVILLEAMAPDRHDRALGTLDHGLCEIEILARLDDRARNDQFRVLRNAKR